MKKSAKCCVNWHTDRNHKPARSAKLERGGAWSLASALANFPLCHYSHWPGLRVWLTPCSEHISCHLCRDRVERKSRRRLRRSFLPNEPGNGSINVLDSQLTRDSDIHSSSKYSTRVKMRQFCERNHVLLKPKMSFEARQAPTLHGWRNEI